jgi:DNA-binding transcriptional MocR family regulator
MTLAVTAAPHDAYVAALLLDAGTPTAGLPQLRELLAARYTSEGLATRPDQILVTSGAQAALALLVDHLHDRRRPIAIENPTFPGALSILRRRRAKLAAIPVTADGWDRDRLTRALRASGAGLAYLMPDFHNPTGAVMPDDLRSEVSVLASRHELTVIADETMRDLDLRVPPRPAPHLAGAGVITIGSTSKVLWSGLCIGWIRASAGRIRELSLNPLQALLAPPPLEQLIACDLLADIAGILGGRRAQLRAQRDHLAAQLAPAPGADEWTYTVPPGGLAIWLRLRHTTAPALAARARRQGLALSPGPQFSTDRTLTRYVRLPYTALPGILTRAVAMLRGALNPVR